MCMAAYLPSLPESLGLFIPLIVVNCIVLGRAEAFASKNKAIPSMLDGLGMGLGFTLSLTLLGTIREILGSGKHSIFPIFNENYGMLIFVLGSGSIPGIGLFDRYRKPDQKNKLISDFRFTAYDSCFISIAKLKSINQKQRLGNIS